MPLTHLHFRPVVTDDAPTVAAHRFSEDLGDPARCLAVRRDYALWLAGVMAQGRYVGWLALDGPRVVGGAGAVLLDWGATWLDPNPSKARLANVFTEADCRRRGIARQLVTRTLDSLQAQGIRSVSLAATQAGQSLYLSLGFQARGGELGRIL